MEKVIINNPCWLKKWNLMIFLKFLLIYNNFVNFIVDSKAWLQHSSDSTWTSNVKCLNSCQAYRFIIWGHTNGHRCGVRQLPFSWKHTFARQEEIGPTYDSSQCRINEIQYKYVEHNYLSLFKIKTMMMMMMIYKIWIKTWFLIIL